MNKSIHRYPATYHNRPSKMELAVFSVVLLLFALITGWIMLAAGCSSPALPGTTKAEVKLETAQAKQLSVAAASVSAAKMANAANPAGLPRTATAGELAVADANLPPAQPEDAREALARVNAALTGKLAEAQTGWNAALAQAQALDRQVDDLQKQVIAERATAAANEKKANDRLCVIAALITGGALSLLAALSLAAGLYFGLTKLAYGAAGLGLCGVTAFFAATQVGTEHFNVLAALILTGGSGGLIYVVWSGFQDGSTLKAKAAGFDQAISAVRKFAGEVADEAEAGAKNFWHWLGVELDTAHKALIADWEKLEILLTKKPASPAKSAPTAVPVATPN